MQTNKIHFTECPRDAMQGIKEFIPTEVKISYLNKLLNCGFDILDFGSFVSPKAIPQMQDTADVLSKLELTGITKLLAIVANERGAQDAVTFDEISYLGFPFSISETFQQRNTNSSIEVAFKNVDKINKLCLNNKKELVVYLSMGFGNPYGDTWNEEIVINWSNKLYNELGIKIMALSDTIGCATPDKVSNLFKELIPSNNNIKFSAHLHVKKENALSIIEAAFNAGCRDFDSAIKGYGGCPMAKDELTGNMPTESLISYFNSKGIELGINSERFNEAFEFSDTIFTKYH